MAQITTKLKNMVEAAGKIAWEKGKKVIILPTIPYGVNTGQKDILFRYEFKSVYPTGNIERLGNCFG